MSENGASGAAEAKAEDLISTSLNLDDYIRELRNLESKDQEFKDHGVLVSVQKLLEIAGVKRRGKQITRRINTKFADAELIFEPALAQADYYGQVRIRPQKPETRSSKVSSASEDAGDELAPRQTEIMLSALKEDSAEFECLALGTTPLEALDEMVQSGYSKMPLFWDINKRTSFIGTVRVSKLGAVIADAYATPSSGPANENQPKEESKPQEKENKPQEEENKLKKEERMPQLDAEDLLRAVETGAKVVSTSERLDDWVQEILDSGYIYGKDADGNIVQIYTRSDIGTYMHRMANAFIRVQNLEEVIRAILPRFMTSNLQDGSFDNELKKIRRISLQDVKSFVREEPLLKSDAGEDRTDPQKKILDLTFAQYVKCFGSEDLWMRWIQRQRKLAGSEISAAEPSESADQQSSSGTDTSTQTRKLTKQDLSKEEKRQRDRLILDLDAVRRFRNELMHGKLKEAIGEELIVLDCLSKGLDAMFPEDIMHDK
ncbi:hypothetical protein [Corynebacterium spheniscorum]|uniref:CBS domain-containing protein n=1 Tax=Corynebacterium spheniscorum TaxID=185761 RepID=A0A1I2UCQ4_9CORY|nr:hypothetical protein [Corynebacterium spheniscorum]KAA8720370.1 hypothetical protein F4V56_07645 [Corynebacterium spheniscorum]SFG74975.1 hypothetical protein SAMN05660282_01818 [Corynebacterium spheniscorum]